MVDIHIIYIIQIGMASFSIDQEERIKQIIDKYFEKIWERMWSNANLNASIRGLIIEVVKEEMKRSNGKLV